MRSAGLRYRTNEDSARQRVGLLGQNRPYAHSSSRVPKKHSGSGSSGVYPRRGSGRRRRQARPLRTSADTATGRPRRAVVQGDPHSRAAREGATPLLRVRARGERTARRRRPRRPRGRMPRHRRADRDDGCPEPQHRVTVPPIRRGPAGHYMAAAVTTAAGTFRCTPAQASWSPTARCVTAREHPRRPAARTHRRLYTVGQAPARLLEVRGGRRRDGGAGRAERTRPP